MGDYTRETQYRLSSLGELFYGEETEDHQQMEILKQAALSFRPFHEAFDAFLIRQGLPEDAKSPLETCRFVIEKANAAGIKDTARLRRTIRSWYGEATLYPQKHEYLYLIAMAFQLKGQALKDFFEHTCLERLGSFHEPHDLIWLYGLENGYSYDELLPFLQKQYPKAALDEENAESTRSIGQDIFQLESLEALDAWLMEHPQISSLSGIRARNNAARLWQMVLVQMQQEDKTLRQAGEMEVLLGLLGLHYVDEKSSSPRSIYSLPKERSITAVFRDNALICKAAADSFPDRMALQNLKKKAPMEIRKLRKLLILLSFGHIALSLKEASGKREVLHKRERIISYINQQLSDAQFPLLDPINPYDWLFLLAAQDETDPYEGFCEIMRLIYEWKKAHPVKQS